MHSHKNILIKKHFISDPTFLIRHPQVISNQTTTTSTEFSKFERLDHTDQQKHQMKFKNSINITPENKIVSLEYQQDQKRFASIVTQTHGKKLSEINSIETKHILKRDLHHELVEKIKERMHKNKDRGNKNDTRDWFKNPNGEMTYKKKCITGFLGPNKSHEWLNAKLDDSLTEPSDAEFNEYGKNEDLETKINVFDPNNDHSRQTENEKVYFYNIKV